MDRSDSPAIVILLCGVSQEQLLSGTVQHREVQRIQIGYIPQLLSRDVAGPWPFDLQQIRAEPRQHADSMQGRLVRP
jgi:hypothetical protein